jgi:hypothetical protein
VPGALAASEQAGRLDHHLGAQLTPRKRRRIALGGALICLPSTDRVIGCLHLAGEPTQAGVPGGWASIAGQ